jgi:hypothetical protein
VGDEIDNVVSRLWDMMVKTLVVMDCMKKAGSRIRYLQLVVVGCNSRAQMGNMANICSEKLRIEKCEARCAV